MVSYNASLSKVSAQFVLQGVYKNATFFWFYIILLSGCLVVNIQKISVLIK